MFVYMMIRLIFMILGMFFVFRGYKDFRREIYFDNPNILAFFPTLNWLILSHNIVFASSQQEVTQVDLFWIGMLGLVLIIPIAIVRYRDKRYFKLYIYNIDEEKIYEAVKHVLDEKNMPYRRKEGEIELSLIEVSIKAYYGNVLEAPYIKVFNHKTLPNFKNFLMDLKTHIKRDMNYYRAARRSVIGIIYFVCGIATLILAAKF